MPATSKGSWLPNREKWIGELPNASADPETAPLLLLLLLLLLPLPLVDLIPTLSIAPPVQRSARYLASTRVDRGRPTSGRRHLGRGKRHSTRKRFRAPVTHFRPSTTSADSRRPACNWRLAPHSLKAS